MKINICALLLAATALYGQPTASSASGALKKNFDYINEKVLQMAEDFPAAKYDFKLKPEMRTFGAVIVHIASGNIYAAKAGRGEKVKWDELDPANYKTKEQAVKLLEKSIADATATLKSRPDDSFHQSVEPW